jgi:hypothetical protein
MHVQATVTGIVGQTNTPPALTTVSLRSLEVKTHAWDPVHKSLPFTVLALFPNTARWQNTPLPRRGALVCITGEIVGKREDADQMALLIQCFNFVSVRGTEAATEASMTTEGQSSPQTVTPRASRWANWQSRPTTVGSAQTTAGKKRAIDAADSDEDSQGIATSPAKNARSASSASHTLTADSLTAD